MSVSTRHILSIDGLGVSYGGVRAVRGFSLSVAPGEIVGLVGESGSGKSTVLRAVAGLLGRSGRADAGSIMFKGRELARASTKKMAALRGRELAYVFQDPTASLDPLQRVGKQFSECLSAHGIARDAAMHGLMRDSLLEMGLDDVERVLASWPHELSGGMCQRVVLAMSAALSPALLLADEPTSALDTEAQRQVADLLLRLRDERGVSMMVVSHNIAAIAQVADRIGIMKDGELVEMGWRDQVLHTPAHSYTAELVAAVPKMDDALLKAEEIGDADAARA